MRKDFLKDRRCIIQDWFLLKVSNAQLFFSDDRSAVRLFKSCQDLQQRCFPGSVDADKSHPVTVSYTHLK